VNELLADAAARAAHYVSTIAHRPVAPLAEHIARLSELGGPLPEQPCNPADVLALLDEAGSPATAASEMPITRPLRGNHAA
jgi:hypothetical protein